MEYNDNIVPPAAFYFDFCQVEVAGKLLFSLLEKNSLRLEMQCIVLL